MKNLNILLASEGQLRNKNIIKTKVDFKREIERLEGVVEFFRSRKENLEPAINLYYGKIISEVDAHLMTGNYAVANRILRTFFRKVEFAFFFVKKVSPVLEKRKLLSKEDLNKPVFDVLAKLKLSEEDEELIRSLVKINFSAKKVFEDLENEIFNQQVILARSYQGYSLLRHHLEDMIADGHENTKKLYATIGVANKKERLRFPTIFKNGTRPSSKHIREMIYQNEQLDLIRLRVERNFEISQYLKDFLLQSHVLESIFNGAINIPGMHKTKLVRLFRFIYDRQARELHFPKINKIIRSTKLDAKERLGLLREFNSTTSSDELLITFGRRVDNKAKEAWSELEKTASEYDADFAKRMEEAKRKAKLRGGLSGVYDKSHVGKLAALLATGGTLSYYYFSSPEKVEVTITEEILDGTSENTPLTADPSVTEDKDKEEVSYPVDVNDVDVEGALQSLEDFILG